jgi:hypothetical protein
VQPVPLDEMPPAAAGVQAVGPWPAGADEARWPLVRDGLAVLVLGLAALLAVVLLLPAEGRIARPLHDALGRLLGHSAFLLPLALVVAGSLLLVRSIRPQASLPRWRLIGLGVLAAGVLPAQDLLAPDDAGLVGAGLRATLLDWLGLPATLVALLGLLIGGVLLTFAVRPADVARMVMRRPRPAATTAVGDAVNVSAWVFAAPRWRGLGVVTPGGRPPRRAAPPAPRPGPAADTTEGAGAAG